MNLPPPRLPYECFAKFTSRKDLAAGGKPIRETIRTHSERVYSVLVKLKKLGVPAYLSLRELGFTEDDIDLILLAVSGTHDFGKAGEFQAMRRAAEMFEHGVDECFATEDARRQFWQHYRRHEFISMLPARLLVESRQFEIKWPMATTKADTNFLNRLLIPFVVASHHRVLRANDKKWTRLHNVEVLPDSWLLVTRENGRVKALDERSHFRGQPSQFLVEAREIEDMLLQHGISVDLTKLLRKCRREGEAYLRQLTYDWWINQFGRLLGRVKFRNDDDPEAVINDDAWMDVCHAFKLFLALFEHMDWWASDISPAKNERERIKRLKRRFVPPKRHNVSPAKLLKAFVEGDRANEVGVEWQYEERPWQHAVIHSNDHVIAAIECGKGKSITAIASCFYGSIGSAKAFLVSNTIEACNSICTRITSGSFTPILQRVVEVVPKTSRAYGDIKKLLTNELSYDVLVQRYSDSDDDDDLAMKLTADSKRCIQPIIAMTIDQMALQMLGSPYGHLISEYNRPDVTIIFDELDAWGPDILFYVEQIIRQMYRCRFVILSGSLSRKLIEWLTKLLKEPRKGYESHRDIIYPQDEVVRGSCGPRFACHVRTDVTLFGLLPNVVEAANTYGPILVRCNYAETAQIVTKSLRSMTNVPVRILIGQAENRDRTRWLSGCDETGYEGIEKLVRCHRPCIVVSTSLADRSLNLDFRRVFVDMCPINTLIQIAGRLNRFYLSDTGFMVITAFTNADGSPRREGFKIYEDVQMHITADLLSRFPDGLSDLQLFGLLNEYQERWCPEIGEHRAYRHQMEHLIRVAYFPQADQLEETSTGGLLSFPFRQDVNGSAHWRSKKSLYTIRRNLGWSEEVYLRRSRDAISRVVSQNVEELRHSSERLSDYRAGARSYLINAMWKAHARKLTWPSGQLLIELLPCGDKEIPIYNLPYDPELGILITDLKRALASLGVLGDD